MSERINLTEEWTVWPFSGIFPILAYPEYIAFVEHAYISGKIQTDITTAVDLINTAKRLGWIKRYEGKKFLDIGAGQNDTVAQLRAVGTRAYAVDPEYSSPDVLDERISKELQKTVASDSRSTKIIIDEAREGFRNDFMSNSDYYKAAFSSELPFRDNFFDLEFSNNCISTVVVKDLDELLQSFSEIVRTLKPRGKAKIFPYDTIEDLQKGHLERAQVHGENLAEGIKYLDKYKNVKTELVEMQDGHKLLVIIK